MDENKITVFFIFITPHNEKETGDDSLSLFPFLRDEAEPDRFGKTSMVLAA